MRPIKFILTSIALLILVGCAPTITWVPGPAAAGKDAAVVSAHCRLTMLGTPNNPYTPPYSGNRYSALANGFDALGNGLAEVARHMEIYNACMQEEGFIPTQAQPAQYAAPLRAVPASQQVYAPTPMAPPAPPITGRRGQIVGANVTEGPCVDEIHAFCATVVTGNGRIDNCLAAHAAELHPACHGSMVRRSILR